MSINILNKYFYNDINNIILDYIICDKDRVKYNKKVMMNQYQARWHFAQRCYIKAGITEPMNIKMFLEHCVYMDWLC